MPLRATAGRSVRARIWHAKPPRDLPGCGPFAEKGERPRDNRPVRGLQTEPSSAGARLPRSWNAITCRRAAAPPCSTSGPGTSGDADRVLFALSDDRRHCPTPGQTWERARVADSRKRSRSTCSWRETPITVLRRSATLTERRDQILLMAHDVGHSRRRLLLAIPVLARRDANPDRFGLRLHPKLSRSPLPT